jgi:hypothetical protein
MFGTKTEDSRKLIRRPFTLGDALPQPQDVGQNPAAVADWYRTSARMVLLELGIRRAIPR